MALRAVIDHPKFARLKGLLRFNKSATLGYLEALWHFCGRYTPQGNVGKYSDADIEAWLEWDGEEGALIEAFVKARWIDIDPEHRLLIHDWNRHADDATRMALKRAKLEFTVPTASDTCSDGVATVSALPVPEPEPEPEPENPPKPPRGSSGFPSVVDYLPDGWESVRQPWAAYQEHRKKTPGVSPYQEAGCQKLAAMLLAENYVPDKFIRLLDHCLASGWKGIPIEVLQKFEQGKTGGKATGLKETANEFTGWMEEVTGGTQIVRAGT